MESSSRRSERGGREGAVMVLKVPSLYGCHLAGCVLGNDSSSLDGLSTQISPESWQSPFRSREGWCSTTSEVSLRLWFPCTFDKIPFIQHPPTCPNMKEPVKTLLIIKLIKRCFKYNLKTMKKLKRHKNYMKGSFKLLYILLNDYKYLVYQILSESIR